MHPVTRADTEKDAKRLPVHLPKLICITAGDRLPQVACQKPVEAPALLPCRLKCRIGDACRLLSSAILLGNGQCAPNDCFPSYAQ